MRPFVCGSASESEGRSRAQRKERDGLRCAWRDAEAATQEHSEGHRGAHCTALHCTRAMLSCPPGRARGNASAKAENCTSTNHPKPISSNID